MDEELVAVERAEFIDAFGLTADGHTVQVLRDNNIRRLPETSYPSEVINEYFHNSRPNDIGIEIIDIYSVHNVNQYIQFNFHGNDMADSYLLWHGTKRHNLIGILENGLTPTRPKGVYGPAIYFADRLALSSFYTDMIGDEVFLLCRVALGNDFVERTPFDSPFESQQFDSILSIGHQIPNLLWAKPLNDRCLVPCGPTIRNPCPYVRDHSPWQYNDYAVFERERIRIKFVVRCRRAPIQKSVKVIAEHSARPGPPRTKGN